MFLGDDAAWSHAETFPAREISETSSKSALIPAEF
jgi:hypothetical protein